jgi:hypothetical protein
MAREVIQNSWDAANELRTELATSDGHLPPDFELEFRFRGLSGDTKRGFIDALDLRGLAGHRRADNRASLGLAPSDCLDHLDDDTPLLVLDVIERGACGMSGPFTAADSKLFLALISVGYTAKRDGAGGSFGYGKAGLIRGSSIRALVAYTCFRERTDDPGVTRRLLGMTYWGQHDFRRRSFTGFARFGAPADGSATPFADADADAVAADIGVDLRTSSRLDELGTTVTLLDPTVRADELCEAIERNWWPALVENEFVVRIVDSDGTTLIPRPRKNASLTAFVRALELATTAQDNSVANEARKDLGATYAIAGVPLRVGRLGIVADLEGWSYPDALASGDAPADTSLVALVRGPRMVVEYLDLGSRLPLVRGTFVADRAIDDLLRQTEPKAHDSWQTYVDEEGIDPSAPKVARSVLQKIRSETRDFQRRLSPPSPRDEDVRLPVLQDLFRTLMDGRGPPPVEVPTSTPDDVPLLLQHGIREVSESHVVVTGTVELQLGGHLGVEDDAVSARISYVFLEDGRAGGACDVEIDVPCGWRRTSDGVVGRLGKAPVVVGFRTAPYRSEWTGRLIVSAERVADGVAP